MDNKIQGFNRNENWMTHIDPDTNIDFFFTQRKVIEHEEYIDPKTIERKKKKKNVTYNFLALNFPNTLFQDKTNIYIDIEIWGDETYHYHGELNNKNGEMPHLLLKLNNDKQLFVKLSYKQKTIDNNDNILKTFKTFIPITKRYQINPED
jgi:hypothetical protein